MKIPLNQYWTLLVNYFRPHRLAVALMAILLLSGIALQLINPQIIRYFIDSAQAGAAPGILLPAALGFLALALVQQVVSVASKYLGESLAWSTTNALRDDLAEHCLRLDLSFHNVHTPGELIERLDGDVTALSNFFSQFVIQLLGNAILLGGILVMLFREDWRVGLTLSAFALAALLILGRFHGIAVPYWAAERQASADLFGFLEERLGGTEDIRANGAEVYVMRGFYRLMRTLLRRSLRAGLQVNLLLNTMFFLFSAGTAAAFAVGAYLYGTGTLSIGSVYIVFYYTSMLERPINAIVHQIEDLQKAGAGIGRIQSIFEQRSKIRDAPTFRGQNLPVGQALAVAFQGVTFGYDDALPQGPLPAPEVLPSSSQQDALALAGRATPPAEKPIVLADISFRLQPGAVLGLLGRTGSGKTTLTRLLFRFYDPDRGAICLARQGNGSSDGLVDIRDIPLGQLRQHVGVVTQNIQLFNASVRDNLTFFDERLSDQDILAVIAELGLSEWLAGLPAGLDTVLEAGAGGLSAGEAQLLAFVRIFLKNPGLVVLDEASSRLDPATEALIERAVERLLRGRSAIIIAHRLGTVQRADQIMILEDGRILEYGPRRLLADDPASRFHQLLQTGLEQVLA
jgi:ATP-binding cassette subfamily B protein